ncbi:Uncharacterised protein [Serratia fonticola]|uniref:Uncharacterized protein n=1 Tax=Serratia fonticola TaxID=47917 RepID=A0A4U9VEV5_SERFO|nr:Uncharacterised protein [Serratia fonticola]
MQQRIGWLLLVYPYHHNQCLYTICWQYTTRGSSPISELNPIDPEFTMNSLEWMLQTTDLVDLPDVTSASTGYPVTINNINNNNLCVRYVTAESPTSNMRWQSPIALVHQGGVICLRYRP